MMPALKLVKTKYVLILLTFALAMMMSTTLNAAPSRELSREEEIQAAVDRLIHKGYVLLDCRDGQCWDVVNERYAAVLQNNLPNGQYLVNFERPNAYDPDLELYMQLLQNGQ